MTTDHLGSPRVVTNSTGGVKARHDYLPFGENVGSTVGSRSTVVGYNLQDGLRQKFTQKERDNESGLDYFGARYYSSAQGRFTRVDPSMSSADRSLPQSWNRYSYVLNSPLVMVDPNGEEWYRLNEEKNGNLYYFEGNGNRQGYTLVHLGSAGRNITNMLGATGQFARFNGHNVTLTDAGIIDRGLYLPPAAADLPDGSEWAGNICLQFLTVGVAGGLILPEATGVLMLLNATAATLALLKEQDANIQANIAASLEADRRAGVETAWRQEVELVKRGGQGSVEWTPQEMEELLRTGRVAGYEGHHINSVNGHPEMARDPSNIRFVRGRAEHLVEHGGNFRNQTEGPVEPRIVPKP